MVAGDVKRLQELIVKGDIEGARALAEQAISAGVQAQVLISEQVIPAMEEVGRLYDCGAYFVPEMLVSARAAGQVLELIEPLLAQSDHEPTGTIVIGTVKGDLHDIGKNIVAMMLRGGGFRVHDLGTDVGPESFVAAVREHKPQLVGMSALLTTTMNSMAATMQALEESGLRDQVKVVIGGAPINEDFATLIGADGYARDASAAVRLGRQLLDSG